MRVQKFCKRCRKRKDILKFSNKTDNICSKCSTEIDRLHKAFEAQLDGELCELDTYLNTWYGGQVA